MYWRTHPGPPPALRTSGEEGSARLEHGLTQFACVTVGDVFALQHADRVYRVRVLETRPDTAISVIETDVEVDFAPPPGYVEPSRAPAAAAAAGIPIGASSPVAVPAVLGGFAGTGSAAGTPGTSVPGAPSMLDRDDSTKFVAFGGAGQTIRGRNSPAMAMPPPRCVAG
jgi:ubiquitin fusion degradation protein 1